MSDSAGARFGEMSGSRVTEQKLTVIAGLPNPDTDIIGTELWPEPRPTDGWRYSI